MLDLTLGRQLSKVTSPLVGGREGDGHGRTVRGGGGGEEGRDHSGFIKMILRPYGENSCF